MYCPNCGSNQSQGRRFCTGCGTNLAVVSQALTGQQPVAGSPAPPIPLHYELERQKELAKGYRFAIIGGGILALKFFSFIFSGPFRGGSPFGFWAIVGFILLAIGISKIIGHQSEQAEQAEQAEKTEKREKGPAAHTHFSSDRKSQKEIPQPVFSSGVYAEKPVPDTGDLEPIHAPLQSVTEDETQHLPRARSSRQTSKQ